MTRGELVDLLIEDWILDNDQANIFTEEEEVDLWVKGKDSIEKVKPRARMMYHSRELFKFVIKVMTNPEIRMLLEKEIPDETNDIHGIIREITGMKTIK